ncbi:hypothetical protein [Pseudomonas sp. 8BK]|uniref:hypothetical protein n=1 Tax=Pseudomonas sp. 8BK TaxID=2653164 RepID=UPI001357773C|nr:hypothetical protein [Pseudomonas sp. 8BK]
MPASLKFPLTWEYVSSTPISVLKIAVKSWLELANPICLIHPHGFYVVLLDRTETEEWRFHYWPKGPRNILGMPAFIHTHDRHIESRILQGQLTNILHEVYEVQTDGQPLYEVAYEGDRYSSGTSNILRRTTTRIQSIVRQREIMRCGDMYHVERHEYHAALVSETLAVSTLVCMHGRSPGEVRVVGLDGYPEAIEFQRTEVDARTLVGLLSF